MKRFREREAGCFGILCRVEKKKKTSRTRKLPFLPRLGIYVDVAGYELVFKKVPLLETLANLSDQAITLRSMARVARDQFAEVSFPILRHLQVVTTSARTISARTDGDSSQP